MGIFQIRIHGFDYSGKKEQKKNIFTLLVRSHATKGESESEGQNARGRGFSRKGGFGYMNLS